MVNIRLRDNGLDSPWCLPTDQLGNINDRLTVPVAVFAVVGCIIYVDCDITCGVLGSS